jgi:DNA repair ATPase RecN
LLKLITFGFVVSLLALAAACSDDDEKTSGGSTTQAKTASPAASVCAQKDAVDAAVSDLTNVDVRAEGTNALKESVDNLKTEVDDLKNSVSSDVKDEVDGLDKAVSDAQDTLSGINDDSTLNQRIDAVQSALTGISTASTALLSALDKEC